VSLALQVGHDLAQRQQDHLGLELLEAVGLAGALDGPLALGEAVELALGLERAQNLAQLSALAVIHGDRFLALGSPGGRFQFIIPPLESAREAGCISRARANAGLRERNGVRRRSGKRQGDG
jgi:hypothetical protein